MDKNSERILQLITQSSPLKEEDIQLIRKALKDIEKELTISEFKLNRTEKIKRTTAVLLEETIAELEQKRKDVEASNAALQKSLEELKAAQNQLIQAEKMASLGELTAGIAHEIQNPLNFVNNFSELSSELLEELKEELEEGNTEEVLELLGLLNQNLGKINHHGKRASSIVKGMLDHSRTSSNKKELTDLNNLCDEYLRLSYHGLRAKDKTFNATYHTKFDTELPKLKVVPQQIGRVILNLINNAFYIVNEKSKEGIKSYEPKVEVATHWEKEQNLVKISIQDNGKGIPQDHLDKIFQPFFTTKPTGQGTGLGLSLSYDIINKGHDGTLKVETELGAGTCFIIELPINNK